MKATREGHVPLICPPEQPGRARWPKPILDLVCLMSASSCTKCALWRCALEWARNTQASLPHPMTIYLLMWTTPSIGKGGGRDWWDKRSRRPAIKAGDTVEKINLLLWNLSLVWTLYLKQQGCGRMEQLFGPLPPDEEIPGTHRLSFPVSDGEKKMCIFSHGRMHDLGATWSTKAQATSASCFPLSVVVLRLNLHSEIGSGISIQHSSWHPSSSSSLLIYWQQQIMSQSPKWKSLLYVSQSRSLRKYLNG